MPRHAITKGFYLVIFLLSAQALYAADDCADAEYRHGISYVAPLKYDANFQHFEWVNPTAPKEGQLHLPDMGTFDSFNSINEKGRVAAGYDYGGSRALVYDTLLEIAIDEPASYYGRLAEGVSVQEDYKWIAFKIRSDAYWHDGKRITSEDVVWTFQTLKEHGSVSLKTALLDLQHIFALNETEICFVTQDGSEINPIMPFAYGSMPILPKHYWTTENRDISKTTVEPPLGSGPYQLKAVDFGRFLIYERIPDYWGQNIPSMRGRYNWDTVKFDYFRDENIMLEAHKAGVIDAREETVSKNWAMQYNFPAVEAGLFKRELRYINRVWGLWWPIFWNQNRERFQDIRVREALWLLYDFPWINRVILFGFYQTGKSFFHNSTMGQSGLPSEAELELLEPLRGNIPDRVFTQTYQPPESSSYGKSRKNTKRALELLSQAGWELQDGELRNITTNEPFTIDFVFVSAALRRAQMPFIQRLNEIGIETVATAPENSHWQHRMRTGTFDGGGYLYIPSYTPGLDLLNRFGSAAAKQDYSLNWARIQDPAIDSLIASVIAARNEPDLLAATRALDRVLLWNFYFIPSMAQPGYRLVYWDKFGEIPNKELSRVPILDAWWWDREKAFRVESGLLSLEGPRE